MKTVPVKRTRDSGDTVLRSYVLHRCDNTRCVNPAHLRIGNQRDNMREMVERKRNNGGRRWRGPLWVEQRLAFVRSEQSLYGP